MESDSSWGDSYLNISFSPFQTRHPNAQIGPMWLIGRGVLRSSFAINSKKETQCYSAYSHIISDVSGQE